LLRLAQPEKRQDSDDDDDQADDIDDVVHEITLREVKGSTAALRPCRKRADKQLIRTSPD
jgi:hypothetical protein